MSVRLCPDTVNAIRDRVNARGLRRTARDIGVSPSTLARALAGGGASERVAAVLRRVPARVRTANDFDQIPAIRPPRPRDTASSWSIPKIRSAIEAQMRGQFAEPKRMAEAMRRDDAIYVARSNRVLPVQVVATELTPHASPRGRSIAKRASESITTARTVLAGIDGTLVDHDVAIGYVEQEANAAGTRIDMRLTEWPLEHVRWNASEETLETTTRDGVVVPITHGDGRWIIFRRYAYMPWREMACLLPAAFVWAAHAEGIADWQSSSRAHGLAKIIGEMAEGWDLTDAEGATTPAAARFLAMLEDLVAGDSAAGLRPAGAKTEFLASGSSAWQVFAENIVSREKAAARIYLGTDAILGSVGGAPGIDIAQLFAVASTRFQSDFGAIEAGLASGLYAPWTAINEGDSRFAPSLRFLLPDPDRDGKRDELARNHTRLMVTLKERNENGIDTTQEDVNELAHAFGVTPVPRLAVSASANARLDLAPTDVAKVVRVDEARAAQGLPSIGDERGALTITELAEGPTALPDAPAPAELEASPSAAPSATTLDPDGDGEPGEPPTDEAAESLATKMTELQIARCEHGASNRCRLCRVERVRDVELGADGTPVWSIAWRAIA